MKKQLERELENSANKLIHVTKSSIDFESLRQNCRHLSLEKDQLTHENEVKDAQLQELKTKISQNEDIFKQRDEASFKVEQLEEEIAKLTRSRQEVIVLPLKTNKNNLKKV